MGGIVLIYVIGGSLIYWIYGKEAAILSLICLTLGLLPLIIIWASLLLLGWFAKKVDEG